MISPATAERRADLPLPGGPTMQIKEPGRTVKLILQKNDNEATREIRST